MERAQNFLISTAVIVLAIFISFYLIYMHVVLYFETYQIKHAIYILGSTAFIISGITFLLEQKEKIKKNRLTKNVRAISILIWGLCLGYYYVAL